MRFVDVSFVVVGCVVLDLVRSRSNGIVLASLALASVTTAFRAGVVAFPLGAEVFSDSVVGISVVDAVTVLVAFVVEVVFVVSAETF